MRGNQYKTLFLLCLQLCKIMEVYKQQYLENSRKKLDLIG